MVSFLLSPNRKTIRSNEVIWTDDGDFETRISEYCEDKELAILLQSRMHLEDHSKDISEFSTNMPYIS